MLSIDVTPLLQARGVKKFYAYLSKAGFPDIAAKKLARGDYRSLPLDHLEKLCLLLKCTPNDVLVWTPDQGQSTDDQPLAALKKGEQTGLEWLAEVQGMSVEQIRELGRKLKEVE